MIFAQNRTMRNILAATIELHKEAVERKGCFARGSGSSGA